MENRTRPPVILIHGAGGNYLSWPPQIRRLANQRVYAIDLPGHGRSEGIGRRSVNEYVDDVIIFMKALKLPAAALAGISMGSAIAMTLALKRPEKVSGLALLGSGVKLRVAPAILAALGSVNAFETGVSEINKNCFSVNAPQRLLEFSKKIMMEISPSVLLGDFLACDQFDIATQINQINAPSLIICGSEDKMTPVKYSESLRDSIPGAQLQVVDGAGHMVMAEQPGAVADMLAQFIETLRTVP